MPYWFSRLSKSVAPERKRWSVGSERQHRQRRNARNRRCILGERPVVALMQQRYYDPQIGRFLSVDPVAARENGDNFNRYAYAANNPYRFTDPDGRQEMSAERFGDSYGSWTAQERAPFEAVAVPVAIAAIALTPMIGPELALGARVGMREAVQQDKPNGVPNGWDKSPSNKGGGEKYTNPANKHDQVRSTPA